MAGSTRAASGGPGTPGTKESATSKYLLERAALVGARKLSYDYPDKVADGKSWPLPEGLAQWPVRDAWPSPKKSLLGVRGPCMYWRVGMTVVCPCGNEESTVHCPNCPAARVDGAFSDVVLDRASSMQAILLDLGFPAECVVPVERPPRLAPRLLLAIAKSQTKVSNKEALASKWVLEEEDRVLKGQFGDYEAHIRTPADKDVVIGPGRKEPFSAIPETRLQLPWQMPAMMVYQALQLLGKCPVVEETELPGGNAEPGSPTGGVEGVELPPVTQELKDKLTAAAQSGWKILLRRHWEAMEPAEEKEAPLVAVETPSKMEEVPTDLAATVGGSNTPDSQASANSQAGIGTSSASKRKMSKSTTVNPRKRKKKS